MSLTKSTNKPPRIGQVVTLVYGYDVHLPAGSECRVVRGAPSGMVAIMHPVDRHLIWFTEDEVEL